MPSGRKKRNAAKRKMDSSTPHGKAQGEKGGSEVVSPMSTEVGQFHEERGIETKISSVEGGGHDGTNKNPENGRDHGGEGEVRPKEEKEDEEAEKIDRSSSTSSSDSSTVMPISQPELVSVEHVEPEKEVEVGISKVEAMPVHVSDEPKKPAKETAGSSEQTVPLQEEEKQAATTVTNDVPVVEKVETSATKQPCLSANEKKLVSLSSNASAELPTVATAENREIETQVVLPPQVTIRRTSWLSCCGLFD